MLNASSYRIPVTFALLAMALFSAAPASAHHVMDGQMPRTFVQGLLSGVGHPIVGLDHFAFIVGVGIVAAIAGLGWMLPALFVGFMCAGLGLHLASVDIPASEMLVALTVVLIGAAIAWHRSGGSRWVEGGLFAVAGTVHGYALAETIVGAEPTPLLAYIIGLVVVQLAVAGGAYLGVRAMPGRDLGQHSAAVRAAGLAILAVGACFAVSATGLVS